MHRVYNSAFMNMLKNEENAKFRSSIKNVLEFDPEILKRFVNFMNNPDEETAVAQFGKDDKYFGVCTLLVTMPGLPMLGHGQIEGFTEKYGMEYRRAYWDEQPDGYLVQRHEREIFPLLHRRRLFAGVENFLLYDFFAPEGHVNEDVFAYSNRSGDDRGVVVYHNKYASARGWIRSSVGYSVKTGHGDDRMLVQKSLGEGLGLHADEAYYCIFRDHVAGLEYIRNSRELCEKGLYVELGAYKYHAFLDFREVRDNDWHHYAHLAAYLNGRGVPSIEETLKEILLQPIHNAFRELVNAGLASRLTAARLTAPGDQLDITLLDEVERKAFALLHEIKQLTYGAGGEQPVAGEVRRQLQALLQLPVLETRLSEPSAEKYRAAMRHLRSSLGHSPSTWGALLAWVFVHSLGKIMGEAGFEQQSRSWIDEWLLGKIVAGVLGDLGLDEAAAWRAVAVVKLLTTHQRWFVAQRPHQVLERLLQDDEVQQFMQVNRYQDVLWFNKEAFEELLEWLLLVAAVQISADPGHTPDEAAKEIAACHAVVKKLERAGKKSGYQVERLLALSE
jgi:predicted metal-dependent HD superfamily phosphohydrolase